MQPLRTCFRTPLPVHFFPATTLVFVAGVFVGALVVDCVTSVLMGKGWVVFLGTPLLGQELAWGLESLRVVFDSLSHKLS